MISVNKLRKKGPCATTRPSGSILRQLLEDPKRPQDPVLALRDFLDSEIRTRHVDLDPWMDHPILDVFRAITDLHLLKDAPFDVKRRRNKICLLVDALANAKVASLWGQ